MGIARGSIKNLAHLNHEVAKNGFASVRPGPQFAGTSGRSSGYGASRSSVSSSSMGHVSTSSGHVGGGTGHH
jgi:hypothetical protein